MTGDPVHKARFKRDTLAQYLAVDAVSNTALQHMVRSPAHYAEYMKSKDVETEARLLGRAVHMLAWEPLNYEFHFAVLPKVDRRTKAGKATYAAFQQKAKTRIPIKQERHDEALRMVEALYADSTVRAVFEMDDAHSETSIYWQEDGEFCKARLDWFAGPLEGGVLVDLKTTRNADPKVFWRDAYNLGYHRQMAWYARALMRLGFSFTGLTIVIIALEKTPPYCPVVYELDGAFLGRGDTENQHAFDRLRECKRLDKWPGYALGPVVLELPPWIH